VYFYYESIIIIFKCSRNKCCCFLCELCNKILFYVCQHGNNYSMYTDIGICFLLVQNFCTFLYFMHVVHNHSCTLCKRCIIMHFLLKMHKNAYSIVYNEQLLLLFIVVCFDVFSFYVTFARNYCFMYMEYTDIFHVSGRGICSLLARVCIFMHDNVFFCMLCIYIH